MKILSSLLLILVGTMVFGIPSQSYADPQLDTLLNIATQARDNLGITISQISNVPAEINQLYSQGSNETDALGKAINQHNTNSAKQHFLAAMKFFKETNDQINSLNATSSNDQQKTEVIQLRGEIARLENMGNLLKSIASKNNIDINFTNFDEMIQSANQDLDSGNLDDASKQLQNANNFVVATHNSLTNIAQERIFEREKNFAENQIVQLNKTSQLNATQNVIPVNSSRAAPITNNSNITPPIVHNNITPPITNNSNITPPIVHNNITPSIVHNNITPPITNNSNITPPITNNSNITPPITNNSNITPPITNNSNITPPIAHNSNITTENNPRDMVAELKKLVSEGKVDQAINLIKIIQAYQKAQSTEKSVEMSSPTNSTVPNTPPLTPTSPTSPTNITASGQNTGHNDHKKTQNDHKPETQNHHQN